MAWVVEAKIQLFSNGSVVETGVGSLKGSSIDRQHTTEKSAHEITGVLTHHRGATPRQFLVVNNARQGRLAWKDALKSFTLQDCRPQLLFLE